MSKPYKFDFGGYATKINIKCSDGRTIRNGAFDDDDGKIVPLVYMHRHDSVENVLGHALLEKRGDGTYAYCAFNDTYEGQHAKQAVENGDLTALSIYANNLKQDSQRNVLHGSIKEVSLVLAGANKGALIDNIVLEHADGFSISESEADITFFDEVLDLEGGELTHSEEDEEKKEEEMPEEKGKTVKEIYDTLNEDQKMLVDFFVEQALKDGGKKTKETDEDEDEDENEEVRHSDYRGDEMKYNIFEGTEVNQSTTLSHADQVKIIQYAKENGVRFQQALADFADENELAHAAEDVSVLFPEPHLVNPGAPEMITTDQTWIANFMNGTSKSPFPRLKTRASDLKTAKLRARGYQKGKKKGEMGTWKLKSRTTDPQTVYIKDKLDRDDIIDITDFDYVAYQKSIMDMALREELALAALVGDGRDDDDEQKIFETHIHAIWNESEDYTLHRDIDLKATNEELQGDDTSKHFGTNYITTEAIIAATLHAREEFKGTGTPNFYCTPNTLNTMLLARDLNGRRIYNTKTELEAALNVNNIVTVEQFSGLQRKDSDSKLHELLAIIINPVDYTWGSAKGGEITSFNDFDIDFNQEKFLMETRLSGAQLKYYSAIALEKPVE